MIINSQSIKIQPLQTEGIILNKKMIDNISEWFNVFLDEITRISGENSCFSPGLGFDYGLHYYSERQ